MSFSDTASYYVSRLTSDNEFVFSDRQLIVDHLKKQSIEPFEKIIEFQARFSGLKLTITNKTGSTFKAKLFSKTDIINSIPPDTIEIDGRIYFDCGEHETAQFWFVIRNDGEICTYNNIDETVNVISSSFDKLIEEYALKDFLVRSKKYEHPYYYNLIDQNLFEACTQSFARYAAASDEYNSWLSDGSLVIHAGTWFDKPGLFIHVYGDDKRQCESLIQDLTEKSIIS